MLSNLPQFAQKCKDCAYDARELLERKDIFLAALFVLVAFSSFGLGRLSALETQREPVRLEQAPTPMNIGVSSQSERGQGASVFSAAEGAVTIEDTPPTGVATQGEFVGSVNSDKYHYPWCSGAQRINEENKIWFASKEEARAAGYSPAGNCKGL